MLTRGPSRASMLVITIMVTMVLMMLVMIVGQNTIVNMQSTSSVSDKHEAHYAAFAGLQKALVLLQYNPDYTTSGTYGTPAQAGAPLVEAMPNNPSLCYNITVRNNLHGSLDQSGVPTPDQIPVGGVELTALAGRRDDPSKPIRAISGMAGLAFQTSATFKEAAFVDSNVTLDTGAKTEAFDFSDWKDSDRDADVHSGMKGWIDTANIDKCPRRGMVLANRHMTVQSSQVDGDVKLPYQTTGKSQSTGLTKGTDYTGNETVLHTETKMPKFTAPYDPAMATATLNDFPGSVVTPDGTGTPYNVPQTLQPGAYQNVSVPSGQTLVLTSGTYYFKDKLDIQGNIKLSNTGAGPIMVYVGKDMAVGSGANLNQDGNPRDLQVYFTDEITPSPGAPPPPPAPSVDPSQPINMNAPPKTKTSTFTMDGGQATMVVAGNGTKAKVANGARLMGAIVSDTLSLSGAKIQYDINLLTSNFVANSPWRLQGVHEAAVAKP